MTIVLIVSGKKESVTKIKVSIIDFDVQEFCESQRIEGKYWRYAIPIEDSQEYEIQELSDGT